MKPFNHCHHEVHSLGSQLRQVSGSRQESKGGAVMIHNVQDVTYGPMTLALETQSTAVHRVLPVSFGSSLRSPCVLRHYSSTVTSSWTLVWVRKKLRRYPFKAKGEKVKQWPQHALSKSGQLNAGLSASKVPCAPAWRLFTPRGLPVPATGRQLDNT